MCDSNVVAGMLGRCGRCGRCGGRCGMRGMCGRDVWVVFKFDALDGEGDDEDDNLNADDAFCEANSLSMGGVPGHVYS